MGAKYVGIWVLIKKNRWIRQKNNLRAFTPVSF
jgi:hypothetical protein